MARAIGEHEEAAQIFFRELGGEAPADVARRVSGDFDFGNVDGGSVEFDGGGDEAVVEYLVTDDFATS